MAWRSAYVASDSVFCADNPSHILGFPGPVDLLTGRLFLVFLVVPDSKKRNSYGLGIYNCGSCIFLCVLIIDAHLLVTSH